MNEDKTLNTVKMRFKINIDHLYLVEGMEFYMDLDEDDRTIAEEIAEREILGRIGWHYEVM